MIGPSNPWRAGIRLLAVTLAALPTAALADPPTLDGLFSLPVKDAAALALGPGPEAFVERSPWNSIQPSLMLNDAHLFGMSFFTRGERIGPGVCAVTLGQVEFDTDPPPKASPDEKAAAAKVPFGQKPLRWVNINRSRRYFAAGPAKAVPLTPGAKPAPLSPAALALDSCDNPVSGRSIFDAPSQDVAISAVTGLTAAISAAGGERPLPFELTSDCGQGAACPDARARLAALKPQAIWAVSLGSCTDIPTATECSSLQVDDPSLTGFGNEYWIVTIAKGPDQKLRAVRLEHAIPPVI